MQFSEAKLGKSARAVLVKLRADWEPIDPEDGGDTADKWLEGILIGGIPSHGPVGERRDGR